MTVLAIIDATRIEAPQGPATQVAGLSLVERAIRLASVCGADQIIVCIGEDDSPLTFDSSIVEKEVTFWTKTERLPEVSADRILIMDAGVVFQRSFVSQVVANSAEIEPGTSFRDARGELAILAPSGVHNLQAILSDPSQALAEARPTLSGGWSELINSEEAVHRASRRLWNGCRKPQDGLVSRYLNRHISISISRVLVSTAMRPNHISALTLSMGVAAALAAAWGGYLGFLLAGILYQINSVVDGVDGELARVRYEFSVTGEWLDTISDDMADLLLYIGLGFGAWRTMPDAPGPFGPDLWLILGLVAAAGKIGSMIVYYRWLIANGRGDLLAFEWSFKDDSDESDQPRSALSRALSATHYFFRKDFIVFVAMILSFGGFLPHLLFALAPGNIIVALSVMIQQLRRP